MTEGELPKYKAMSSEPALENLRDFIQKIESGEFKVVGNKFEGKNEVLVLPNPGGKPHTRATGKKVQAIEITICNQVD